MTMSAVVDRLLNSPAGRAAAEEERQAQLSRRRDLAAQLAALEAPALKEALQLRAKRDQAWKAVLDADKLLKERQEAHAVAQGNLGAASNRHSQARAALERELRATASPRIDQALDDLQAMVDSARQRGVEGTSERVGETEFAHGRLVGLSTRASVEAHLAAIRVAREQLEDLKLQALDEAAVAKRIGELKGAIPSVRFEPVGAA